ncbi:hypothetical protein [Kitasatospora sp. NPDC057015]
MTPAHPSTRHGERQEVQTLRATTAVHEPKPAGTAGDGVAAVLRFAAP